MPLLLAHNVQHMSRQVSQISAVTFNLIYVNVKYKFDTISILEHFYVRTYSKFLEFYNCNKFSIIKTISIKTILPY
jgi:hypothetical protein